MDSTLRSSWSRTNNPPNITKTLLPLSSSKASSVVQSCRHQRNPLLNPPTPWRHVHRLNSRLHLNSRLLSLHLRGLNSRIHNKLISVRSHNLHSLRSSFVQIQAYILALRVEMEVRRLMHTKRCKFKGRYQRPSEGRIRMLGREPQGRQVLRVRLRLRRADSYCPDRGKFLVSLVVRRQVNHSLSRALSPGRL